MKTCPICNAVAFDDATTCFGCLYRFPETQPGGDSGTTTSASQETPSAQTGITALASPPTPLAQGEDNDARAQTSADETGFAATQDNRAGTATNACEGGFSNQARPISNAESAHEEADQPIAQGRHSQTQLHTRTSMATAAEAPLRFEGVPGFYIFIQPTAAMLPQFAPSR